MRCRAMAMASLNAHAGPCRPIATGSSITRQHTPVLSAVIRPSKGRRARRTNIRSVAPPMVPRSAVAIGAMMAPGEDPMLSLDMGYGIGRKALVQAREPMQHGFPRDFQPRR